MSELNGVSVKEALDELTDVYRVYFDREINLENKNDQLYKLAILSKRQEVILKAISQKFLL